MQRLVVGLLLALTLSGCFTPAHHPSQVASGRLESSGTTAPAAPPALTETDTLRFGAAPNFTTVHPRQAMAIHVPISSPFASGSPNQLTLSQWNFTWTDSRSTALTGNLTLTLDVEGTVLGTPSVPPNANDTYRFWLVNLLLLPPDAAPTDERDRSAVAEIWEPSTVPNGIRVLKIPFTLPAAPFAPGWHASVQVSTAASVITPGSSIDLLTASTIYDSTLQFSGLELPVEVHHLALTANR